jgi:hypothetical protein
MLINTPPPFRSNRRPLKAKATTTPLPVHLTLSAATYDLDSAALTLVFDRAINIAGIDAEAFYVNDDVFTHTLLQGDPAQVTQTGPTAVQVVMQSIDDATPGPITMTVEAGNGIVAVAAGGAWAGVTGLGLPWP